MKTDMHMVMFSSISEYSFEWKMFHMKGVEITNHTSYIQCLLVFEMNKSQQTHQRCYTVQTFLHLFIQQSLEIF
jgi:hypothetical protein